MNFTRQHVQVYRFGKLGTARTSEATTFLHYGESTELTQYLGNSERVWGVQETNGTRRV